MSDNKDDSLNEHALDPASALDPTLETAELRSELAAMKRRAEAAGADSYLARFLRRREQQDVGPNS